MEQQALREDASVLLKKLEEFDIVSFDIFDTLILRPFKNPQDLFKVLSAKFKIFNFADVRAKAEKTARDKAKRIHGHTEVTIYDIYKEVNLVADLDIERGVRTEFETEKAFCYANPYMKKIFDELLAKRREVILVSDMYFPHGMMRELLESCSFRLDNISGLFVSCDYGMTKRNGYLYKAVLDKANEGRMATDGGGLIHIDDNLACLASAEKNGIATYYYKKNIDIKTEIDKIDMSPTIGSLYSGIIHNCVNNGEGAEKFDDVYYKYGFMYSSLFVYGYVNWLHKFAVQNGLDKLLFLARDGYIQKKVYDMLYDDIPSEYCLWSRTAALRTAPERNLPRYIWQFITRFAEDNSEITIKQILDELNLNFLEEEFYLRNISLQTVVDARISGILRSLILESKDKIIESSKTCNEAAKQYYLKKVGDSKKIGIVDIGYGGASSSALKHLFEKWGFGCDVKNIVAISLSRRAGIDDTMDLCGDMNIYAISNYKNYDFSLIFQKNGNANMSVIEVLTSAPKPPFLHFDLDKDGEVVEHFGEEETENYGFISQLHDGIFDFIKTWMSFARGHEFLREIPARDAVAPLVSLMNEAKYKVLANDLKDFGYSLLVPVKYNSGKKSFQETILRQAKGSLLKRAIKKIAKLAASNKIAKLAASSKIGRVAKRIRRMLKNEETRIRYYYAKCYDSKKVLDNVILAQSYNGTKFACSPYYMVKELRNKEKYGKYNIYVGIKKENIGEAKKTIKAQGLANIKTIAIHSKKYARILSQAKYLINNVAFPYYFIKKEKQICINTWHGTPLKGLGKSIKDAPHEIGNHQREFFMLDYFIMPNEYTYSIMRNDYMLKDVYAGEYIVSGYPRNSIFYDDAHRQELRKRLGLQGKKVICYMPTWRRAGAVQSDKTQLMFHSNKIVSLLDAFEEKLADDTVVYVNIHYVSIYGDLDLGKYKKIRRFPQEEYETYEFLAAADCLITDYSSVMFDFANTERKIILYAYDALEYANSRSMYTSIYDMPFSIVATEDDVIEEIQQIDAVKPYKDFKSKFCAGDSADLCAKICEHIFLKKESGLNIKREETIRDDNILVNVGNLDDNYKRELIFKALEQADLSNKNLFLNFIAFMAAKNKFFVNTFSDKYNYISLRGAKLLTVTEAVAQVLYRMFEINGKWIERKVNNIYEREAKRLFPNIKFEKVLDMTGGNVQILNLYSKIDARSKEIYIISNNIYKLNESSAYKREVERLFDSFANIYVATGITENAESGECKLKVAKQARDALFTNAEPAEIDASLNLF